MREETLTDVLVDLADTLTDDFDVIDFLHELAVRCVELLDVGAAGVLLDDAQQRLRLVASADERPAIVELFQLQVDDGPARDAWLSGGPIGYADLTAAHGRWPDLAEKTAAAGFRGAYALPMRLRNENIGALSLLRRDAGTLDDGTARAVKVLVDVATIGLLQARVVRRHEVLIEQLQAALTSRVVIEQAKGFVAEWIGADVATAFTVLRGYARRTGQRLTDVAEAVVTRSMDLAELVDGDASRQTSGGRP